MRLPVSMLGLLLAAGVAAAQTTSPSSSTQHLNRLDRMAVLLDLTDTQKLQVQQILETQRQQMKAFWQQQSSSGAKPNFQQLRTERQQLQQQTLAELQKILSPEQVQKFQVLTSFHGPRWHHHGQHGATSSSSTSSSSAQQ